MVRTMDGNRSGRWKRLGWSCGVLQVGLLVLHETDLFLRGCIGARRSVPVTFLKLLDELKRFHRALLPDHEIYEA